MKTIERHAVPLAACALVVLLTLQILPTLSAAAQTGQAEAAPAVGPHTVSSTPDYLILGQLKGSSVTQSQRPRSVPLVEGIQYASTYYTAKDLQDAYGATSLYSSGYTGRGETIAIIDAYGDPTIRQDLATFDAQFGLPAVNLTITPVGPYDPSLGIKYGWDAEVALDVETAHAMAPYAHIDLLVAANASNALFEAVKQVVDGRLANVVSMSWGLGENSYGESGFSAAGFLNYAYLDYYFQKGAAEGISFFASSGDYGAFDGTTTATADYPSTSPFVTGVGGTTLYLTPTSGYISALNSSATYQGEAAWSISPQYIGAQISSGGGYSALFSQPYYQAGATASHFRSAPDVAADANPYTGMVIVLEGGYYVIGGTSLGSPAWAGMTAVMDQYMGKGLGLLNPYLYSIYGNKTAYDSAFNQVTFGYNGAYQAGPGYNLVTGLGSPNLPKLAADVRAQAQALTIRVNTDRGSSSSAPSQYSYGETIKIAAAATDPRGGRVLAGTFTASIDASTGHVATVPLSYNGSAWVGTHTVASTDPPGSWVITVSGSSGGSTGEGIGDVDVGASIGILAPVPYPFGLPAPPGVPFAIQVTAAAPDGHPLAAANIMAHLLYGGRDIADVPLLPLGGGSYQGLADITGGEPQGTYSLVVSAPGVGSAYSYVYVGQGVVGVMVGPNDEAIPAVSAGQQVTFLAKPTTSTGVGVFTSTVTAKVYSLDGTLVSSVRLQPAPNKVQFGVLDFFSYQQANYTIPANFTQGFYKLEFLSSFNDNSSAPTQFGNFTTGFYVSGTNLGSTITHVASVFEGQDIVVQAKVTDSSGAPVTSGVFFATVIPSGYAYEAYLTDFYGYTGVPMQYDATAGAWVGTFQVPSVLTSPNAFTGNILSLDSGPWTVWVAGESGTASNVVPAASYIDVLPFTYYSTASLSKSNVQTAPLVTSNGTSYALSNIGTGSLTITGLHVTLTDDSIGTLTLVGSTVKLVGSQVGSISSSNSTFSLLGGSTYRTLSPSLPQISVAGLSRPISGSSTITVTVSGEQLANGSLVATVDGVPLSLKVSPTSSGLTATGSIDTGALVDGVHSLVVRVSQSDGMNSTLTLPFSSQGQAASVIYLAYAGVGVSILALVVAIIALRKRHPVGAPFPPPPQV
ncbi:MAG: hypothetical protein KGI38_02750 [Thaumarchaeota archaeon]|nr:hypothetical protein [Nitrososphaerota archaeon]